MRQIKSRNTNRDKTTTARQITAAATTAQALIRAQATMPRSTDFIAEVQRLAGELYRFNEGQIAAALAARGQSSGRRAA